MSGLAAFIEHTCLAPAATPEDVERLCAEALEHGFPRVCVNGVYVARCAQRLRDSRVGVCSVVGFPLGATASRSKVREAELALEDGACELDMVLQIGALRAGEHALVRSDIEGVVAAAQRGRGLVKVILETGLLSREQIVTACRLAEEAGADYVKTCTGLGPRGVTREDVVLLRASVGSRVRIKAAGGIRTAAFARELVEAGADRLGCSSSVEIVAEGAGPS